jgi:hypothetical protein
VHGRRAGRDQLSLPQGYHARGDRDRFVRERQHERLRPALVRLLLRGASSHAAGLGRADAGGGGASDGDSSVVVGLPMQRARSAEMLRLLDQRQSSHVGTVPWLLVLAASVGQWPVGFASTLNPLVAVVQPRPLQDQAVSQAGCSEYQTDLNPERRYGMTIMRVNPRSSRCSRSSCARCPRPREVW